MRFRFSKENPLCRMFRIRTEVRTAKGIKAVLTSEGEQRLLRPYMYCVYYRKWWQRKYRYFATYFGNIHYKTLAEAQEVAFNIRHYIKKRKRYYRYDMEDILLYTFYNGPLIFISALLILALIRFSPDENCTSSPTEEDVENAPNKVCECNPKSNDTITSFTLNPK